MKSVQRKGVWFLMSQASFPQNSPLNLLLPNCWSHTTVSSLTAGFLPRVHLACLSFQWRAMVYTDPNVQLLRRNSSFELFLISECKSETKQKNSRDKTGDAEEVLSD